MVGITFYSNSDKDWDDYVVSRADATVAHLYGWREIIEKSYGHRGYYLTARRGDKIVGILPLIHVKSLIFGNHLVSMPFLDYGGIVAEDAEVSAALHHHALDLARNVRAGDLVYRHTERSGLGLSSFQGKVTFLQNLPRDEEALWKSIPSERRNRVRKTQRTGLRTRFTSSEDLEIFYAIWSANMRDIGSPAHSKTFFEGIFRILNKHSGLILVDDKHRETIAAGLVLKFRETLSLPWVSSRRQFFDLYPNNILYWDLMAKACAEGFTVFDFGRSSINSGTYEFKKRWNAEIVELNYEYVSLTGKDVKFLTQDDKSFSPLISLWKRMPLQLTNLIGPPLRGGLIN